uniref:Isoaspartyl peptidase/L-asparaginase n=1 Tax=Oryzias sinensis TaxID=183150 RepID=A0A8C8DLV2_9TELE
MSNNTLVIHGGAGEDMMLNNKVADIIEFALQTALTLGSQVLQQGGSSLNAVQRSVEALEDCFLFNAGKGSVFNKDGVNELEATIVDGSTKRVGSVACVKSIKNPIKAARAVMDKSPHALIVGQGAEDFLQSLEGKDRHVGPEYFHTDIRQKELFLKLGGGNSSKGSHPQTVGAVALDSLKRLAAASSTGGLVGKLKGRVGDTAVVGAGIYADEKVAITCSGDGDVFLKNTLILVHPASSSCPHLILFLCYMERKLCQTCCVRDWECSVVPWFATQSLTNQFKSDYSHFMVWSQHGSLVLGRRRSSIITTLVTVHQKMGRGGRMRH